jgi:8-amino-7-oxononanoate synthase
MKFSPRHPLAWIDDELQDLEALQLRRRLQTHAGPQQVLLEIDGRELINFGSNDYLALASDPRLAAAAASACDEQGWGAGASPLVTGHAKAHELLEARLAEFEGTEAALLFSSGYAANLGTLAAIAGPEDAIYSDAKNHASIIDGCRLSRAEVHVFKHRDASDLQRLLDAPGSYRRRLIVSEALFSMDGDLAPLDELALLAERYDAMLMIDEAHATGVFGEHGRGVAEMLGLEHPVDIRVGTLSKALGSAGGFVCGSRSLVDWLANRARSYVFSTASPPAICSSGMAALAIVRDEPGRRIELVARAADLRERLQADGWNIGASASQIVPVIVEDPERAIALSSRLRDLGLLVPAIRPPSVPHGESLLRISLTWAHQPQQIDALVEALRRARDW